MASKKKLDDLLRRSDMTRQNNTRGMGLARDVKAGQARPLNPAYVRSIKRRTRNR